MTSTADDIGFGFDAEPFNRGIKQVSKGMSNLEKSTESAAKNMGKSMFWAMAKVQALGAAMKGIGNGIMGVVKEFMPEIGQTFGIAREIFFKNFLWPIRQQLAPMLQKMLNWVRDNRAMFVSWGQNAANVFRIVFNVLGTAWTMIKSIWNAISPLFGTGPGGIQQGLNLLVAKIATVTQFLLNMLQPALFDRLKGFTTKIAESGILKNIIDLAVAIGQTAWSVVSGFFEGLGPWLIKAIDPFSKIVKSIGDIWVAVFGDGKGLDEFFKWFGDASGWTIVTALQGIADFLNSIVTSLKTVRELGTWFKSGDIGSPETTARSSMVALLGRIKMAKNAADVNKALKDIHDQLNDTPLAQGEFRKQAAEALPGALKDNPALGGLKTSVLYNGFGGPTKDATTLGIPNGVFSVQVEVVDKTAGGVKAEAKKSSLPSNINGSLTASGVKP